MSNAGRLAKQAYETKPAGLERHRFKLQKNTLDQIVDHIPRDVSDASYAAAISYAEGLNGLINGKTSWSVVKLYYSTFYCIRSLLMLEDIIPFHYKDHFLLDTRDNYFHKGGSSSHHWNWNSLRKIKRLSQWYYSADSQQAYENLREKREDANYRHAFIDPYFPDFLEKKDSDLSKTFRTYRDDTGFFYTYLSGHFSLAYPTMLLFYLEQEVSSRNITWDEERRRHIKSIWPLKDRCPLFS